METTTARISCTIKESDKVFHSPYIESVPNMINMQKECSRTILIAGPNHVLSYASNHFNHFTTAKNFPWHVNRGCISINWLPRPFVGLKETKLRRYEWGERITTRSERRKDREFKGSERRKEMATHLNRVGEENGFMVKSATIPDHEKGRSRGMQWKEGGVGIWEEMVYCCGQLFMFIYYYWSFSFFFFFFFSFGEIAYIINNIATN